ncbi:MAG: acyl-CoA dehydrogenase family protein [Oscillospiraceae bacterium]
MKLTENQEMYLNLFNEFVQQEVAPRIKELDEVDEYPIWMRDRMAELGFTRLVARSTAFGESMTTLLMLIIEASKYNNNLASILNCSNNANKLLSFANQEQIDRFLPMIVDEGKFMGMAYTEPSGGSDSRAISTTAVLDGDEWVINGTKSFISYRCAVGSWQVSAKTVDPETGKEGISVFLVAADAPGIAMARQQFAGAAGHRLINFPRAAPKACASSRVCASPSARWTARASSSPPGPSATPRAPTRRPSTTPRSASPSASP